MMLHTKYKGTRHCRFRLVDLVCFPNIKVKQKANPRYRYNQVPQKVTKYNKRLTQESQEMSPFPAGDHMPMQNMPPPGMCHLNHRAII